MTITADQVLLYLNGVICGTTCLSVLMYQRDGAAFSRWKSLLAYALVVGTGAVAWRTVFGIYREPVDPAEFIINLIMCISMVTSRGNVSALFAPQKLWRGKRDKSWI